MARIHMLLIFVTVTLQCYHLCDAQCQIDGFTNWLTPLQDSVVDTHIGTFFVRNTNNIIGITSIVHRDGLNRGPYLDISILDSQLRIGTNNAFEEYEENETSQSIGATITFSCSGSQSSGVLVVTIDIIDTNNNAPRFLPTNQYEFTVIPPLPPGFLVTGCENQITVRDIDLTTQRIDFTIENNPDFEIFLDTSSSAPKEFRAVIRTKSFLRSIPEPLDITITATDVDLTNDLPLTEKASILIVPNQEFLLPDELIFSRTFYIFNYTNEQTLVAEETISLIQGFDKEVVFNLEGQYSEYFELLYPNDNEITLALRLPLTSEIVEEGQIFLILRGEREHTSGTSVTLIVQFPYDSPTELEATFDKVLYSGQVLNNVVTHEPITVLRYSGEIILSGEFEDLFMASLTNGAVSVQLNSSFFPTDLQYVVLKMTALEASSVLLLDVVEIDVIPPMLSFSSLNYSIQINELQTGIIGQVTATADNGETVVYALKLDNEHLGGRLSINSKGEILASAPIITGSYSFGIVASTIFTGVTANAAVYLTVVNSTSCEIDDSITPLPPLLIIERYEEEPHLNLVPLDRNIYPDCKYQLTNVWPIDQTWLYVDDNGLHTTSIDREHESIAFMHVSQIQVELNLFCGDESRRKRSLGTDVQYDLRSYDYGQNHWILTDNIPHNPTRTLVNLIVLDINDNAPVFVGKENEPIIVGYPHRNIEEIVLPRALVELKATDADIGENAELLYLSSEENIVVSPKDGSVHVRNYASLEDNSRLTVHATDRNGDGLTGSIEVLVRLLDANHIAVITVRNAFIGDETQILENFSRLLGYDVKTLRSAVISERLEDDLRIISRAQLQTDAAAASLRLYVYGLQYENPVDVTQLITDLNSNIVTVSLAQVLSLEDHLEGMQRCPVAEREIGFLVATIVLAALLFILIVVVAVWFALKWKNKSPYEQFSDQNSLASRNQSIESPKTDNATLPRIDLEELRKSEKRLQDLLDTPVENVGETIEPFNAKQQVPAYNVAFDIPNEITPTSSTERSNDSNVSIDGNNQFSEETIPSNNVTFEIPETTIASNTVNFDLPIETIVNISSNNPNGPIVIQSIDKLKDNIDESEDDDEFGERQRARRKSMVTFNENVEKIIHLEDRQSDDESNPDIEIYKF